MAECKLRIKYGEHEFESEGTADSVQAHLAVFKQLIGVPSDEAPATATEVVQDPTDVLKKLTGVQGRILFMRVPARSGDAVLLILLAQKTIRKNEQVTGSEIMGGLRLSGIKLPRIDHMLRKHAAQGAILSTGSGRARRYRLSEGGIQRAWQIVEQLSPLVR